MPSHLSFLGGEGRGMNEEKKKGIVSKTGDEVLKIIKK